MNITRILGQNNKIYRKFGDYCTSEAAPNQCCVICCFCQEVYDCEDDFWAHMQQMHDYTPAQLCKMDTGKNEDANRFRNDSTTQTLQPIASDDSSPQYAAAAAECLEGVGLNDSQAILDLNEDITHTFFEFKEKEPSAEEGDGSMEITNGVLPQNENIERVERHRVLKKSHTSSLNGALPTKFIDVEKLMPKQLLGDGELLKFLLLQIQRANNEFKYKISKLTQAVKLIESELKKEPGQRTLKRYMKIIPDQPFSSRDEVLTLDDELHHSKEMRDALYEETLALATQNADVFCRMVWRFIMTDEVSNQFCWRGVVNDDKVIKYPIRDMTMLEVFQSAFREKFPEHAHNFLKDRTVIYFNRAHDRLKRKQLMSKADSSSDNNSATDFPYSKESFDGDGEQSAECHIKRVRNVEFENEVAVAFAIANNDNDNDDMDAVIFEEQEEEEEVYSG